MRRDSGKYGQPCPPACGPRGRIHGLAEDGESELVLVDTIATSKRTTTKVTPGQRYYFPEFEKALPVSGLKVYFFWPVGGNFAKTYDGKDVLTLAEFTFWTLTLTDGDGGYFLKDVPLGDFSNLAASDNFAELVLDRLNVDPLASYLTSWSANASQCLIPIGIRH